MSSATVACVTAQVRVVDGGRGGHAWSRQHVVGEVTALAGRSRPADEVMVEMAVSIRTGAYMSIHGHRSATADWRLKKKGEREGLSEQDNGRRLAATLCPRHFGDNPGTVVKTYPADR